MLGHNPTICAELGENIAGISYMGPWHLSNRAFSCFQPCYSPNFEPICSQSVFQCWIVVADMAGLASVLPSCFFPFQVTAHRRLNNAILHEVAQTLCNDRSLHLFM